MKHLGLADFNRLAIEIGATTENELDWAERSGIDPEVVESLGEVAKRAIFAKMMQAAEEQFGEGNIGPPETIGELEERELEVDIGQLISSACISAFVLGFETHKQFGGTKDGDE